MEKGGKLDDTTTSSNIPYTLGTFHVARTGYWVLHTVAGPNKHPLCLSRTSGLLQYCNAGFFRHLEVFSPLLFMFSRFLPLPASSFVYIYQNQNRFESTSLICDLILSSRLYTDMVSVKTSHLNFYIYI